MVTDVQAHVRLKLDGHALVVLQLLKIHEKTFVAMGLLLNLPLTIATTEIQIMEMDVQVHDLSKSDGHVLVDQILHQAYALKNEVMVLPLFTTLLNETTVTL